MTLKTCLVTLALTMLPMGAIAQGCSDKEHQAQSCATGSTWDDALKSCVKQITS